MRWDRLFADLEAGSDEVAAEERDTLVAELTDEDWGATAWLRLLGGRVVLEVEGDHRVEGALRSRGAEVLRIASAGHDVVVAVRRVVAVTATGPRAVAPGRVASRLGWRHVFRQARDEGEEVEVRRGTERPLQVSVDVVGQDFVRVRAASGALTVVPFAALTAVRLPH
ncbi:hypothetical protein ASD11_10675 [Aeromicrobium sp. Root495]|uniref:hypothetical protein n=1 Tax=Aeromicrobium sp. Root495 TaxID=1736550 RepID=UPI0007002DAD|nr:hypothetical protein [Aeromicrobium sp. Root495]KQY59960.1 hypothetical protein ASD11_10675 [Aeromicrobium sp. Root495]